MSILTASERKPRTGGMPSQLVLLLHGWGADGANLIDLADMFADSLPSAHFIAPNAPDICEVNPYGFQWFSLNDRTPERMLAGAQKSAQTLNAYIDAKLAEFSLTNAELALVGFSQGTMLALHVGLRRSPQIAGIVGYSGALIAPENLKAEIQAKPPVCLIHGQMDDVVHFGAMEMAEGALHAHGVSVESHARPGLGHSIDMQGIEIAKRFLERCFS